MPGTTDATIADWLERNYQPPKLGNIAFKDAPMTAWLPHDENAGGDSVQLRWKYGMPQGHGTTYAQAKARADLSGLKPAKVVLDYETYYSVATIDNTAIERAAGGNLAATEVLQTHINDAMEAHGDHLETFLFSDGFPSLGTVQPGSISGATLIVSDDSDIEKWEVDLEIVFAASRTTGVLRGANQSLIVTKVDRDTRMITFSANIATIAGGGGAVANGDHMFIKTTREDAVTPGRQVPIGILGFIPASVSGADAFGDSSLNRSTDPFRLAGVRLTIPAGTSVKQGLIDFFVRCGKYKIKPDALWVSYERWGDLIKELGNEVEYTDIKNEKYGITISGVVLYTPKGKVPVIASAKCPYANVWALTRKSWKIFSVNGALIRPATRYQKALDSSSGDSVELRWRSFWQVGCLRPHENAIGVFA